MKERNTVDKNTIEQFELKPNGKPDVPKNYFRPKPAENMMKRAAGINQTVWICGAAGVGKTSFAMDYFSKRQFDYYTVKETIPEQIVLPNDFKKRKIVIIDDLYNITDTDFQKEWLKCIESLIQQENVWLILISRSDVPRWLHTLSIDNIFYVIGEKDLLLTREQTEEYFVVCGQNLKEETLDKIWELGHGHPLWNHICNVELFKTDNEDRAIRNSQTSIWQYVNTYVCDSWETEVLETIMKLSILKTFDVEMAVYMTGNKDVNIILLKAQEAGNFLKEKDGVYTIHKTACYAMIQRMNQNCDIEYINSLYVRAGDCLKIKGKLMGALKMYEKAGDKRSIADLLIQNARENPSSGHYYEMKHYYMQLPEDVICKSVELMGAMCMLQALFMNEEESERWYKKLKQFAKKQTGNVKIEANNKLLYLDIALPHRGTSNMITIMKNAGFLLLHHKAKLPEFSVTSNLPSQMNGGKDFCGWSKKDKELAASLGKVICLVLGSYGKGMIDLALAESGLEKGNDNYEVENLAIRGRMEAEAGGKQEQCFVGVGIMAWLSILTNHPQHALDSLDGFCEIAKHENLAPMLLKNIDAMKCRIALYQGRTADITQWMENAPNENQEFFPMERLRYLTKIRIYLADHRYEEAKHLLSRMEIYAQKMKRTYIAIETKLLQSILYYRIGDERWKKLISETISEAESYHFVRILSREGAALIPLFNKADITWKDIDYKKQVEVETSYMAQIYPAYLRATTEYAVINLSENAIKILKLQALGQTVNKIADELGISPATVKYHNKETYKKLGVNTKAQAINEARNRELI